MGFTRLRSTDGAVLYAWPWRAKTRFFFLGSFEAAAPDQLSLVESWATPGAYLFCPGVPSAGLRGLLNVLGLTRAHIDQNPNARALAWLPDPEGCGALPVALVWGGTDWGHVSGVPEQSVPFGNIRLRLPSTAQITLGDERPDQISIVDHSRQMGLYPLPHPDVPPDQEPQGLIPTRERLILSLDPTAPGGLTGTGEWGVHHFYRVFRDDWRRMSPARGGELRYCVPGGEHGARQLVYPLLPAVSESDDGEFSFDVALDPLAATDASRTHFRFTRDPGITASGAFTVGGHPVGLRPLLDDTRPGTGFYLGRRPRTGVDSPDDSGQPFVYLAPMGSFALALPGDATPVDGGRLMCGTSGLEYLRVLNGDRVEFVPGRPAFAPGFPEGSLGVGLNSTFTTSWVRLRPQAARGYHAQPAASVNYGDGVVPRQEAGTMDLPAAVSCLVRTLDQSAEAVFPMAFYGGTPAPTDEGDQDTATLARFEKQVLTPLRGTRLRSATTAGTPPPEPDAPDRPPAAPAREPTAPPVFSDANGAPLPGGRTATPDGLLVEVNDDSTPPAAKGTWKRVLLASRGSQTLSLNAADGTGTVDPVLASALVHDQVFLVLNDWSRFRDVSAELRLAGFNFQIAPPDQGPDTVLVVKHATKRSLTDLVDSPADWAAPDYFVGDGDAVDRARQTLKAALRTARDAKGETDDPFGYFRDVIATSPGWTGVITFNSPIDGNGMPPSFQMLFAGIDGQLTAHHFGVEANRIQRGQDGLPEIVESSLFGVVHYPPPASGS